MFLEIKQNKAYNLKWGEGATFPSCLRRGPQSQALKTPVMESPCCNIQYGVNESPDLHMQQRLLSHYSPANDKNKNHNVVMCKAMSKQQ